MQAIIPSTGGRQSFGVLLGAVGGPPFHHWDSVLTKAFQAVANGGDPKFFNYPGLVIYLNMLVYKALYGVPHWLGKVDSGEAFTAMHKTGYLTVGAVQLQGLPVRAGRSCPGLLLPHEPGAVDPAGGLSAL